ncbi:MAG TPA: hypothetical protein VGR62_20750 [Candidatus Binatia bacterium]|jgi:predicted metal-dependent enzyme (double-stranded beta helix superfamily)|nr:hypothetical protein [Candidatus Binatia bacterium]
MLHIPDLPDDRRLGIVDLQVMARAIAGRVERWRHIARYDPHERWFVQLYRTADLEAWLLTWPATRGIELHDHGDSAAVVLALDGELVEHYTDLHARPALRRRRWTTGTMHTLTPGHVHDVHNDAERPATSIHVYAPPLSTMTFYDHRAQTFLSPLRTEPARGPERPATVAS